MKEGYTTPSFFTEIMDKGTAYETKNFSRGGFTIKITYFQKEKNEAEQLQKVDEIKELFGMYFCVGSRKLKTLEYSHDFIGQYSDILQITVDFEYKENIYKEETAQTAEKLYIDITNGKEADK